MKTYIAQRPADDAIGNCVVVVKDAPRTYALRHVVYHSPTGFEWGYGGSGPADTALSILANYFDESPERREISNTHAWYHHQAFKWHFIAPAPRKGFTLTEQQISEWLQAQQQPLFGAGTTMGG